MGGKEKTETEWGLVCLSHNLKKMFNLMQGCVSKHPVAVAKQNAHTLFDVIRSFFGLQPGFRGMVGSVIEN